MVVRGKGWTDSRKACIGFEHPRGVLDRTPTRYDSGTLARVQDIYYAATRRSPPPEKPPATSGYRLATLWVGRSRMCKLQLPPKEERENQSPVARVRQKRATRRPDPR